MAYPPPDRHKIDAYVAMLQSLPHANADRLKNMALMVHRYTDDVSPVLQLLTEHQNTDSDVLRAVASQIHRCPIVERLPIAASAKGRAKNLGIQLDAETNTILESYLPRNVGNQKRLEL